MLDFCVINFSVYISWISTQYQHSILDAHDETSAHVNHAFYSLHFNWSGFVNWHKTKNLWSEIFQKPNRSRLFCSVWRQRRWQEPGSKTFVFLEHSFEQKSEERKKKSQTWRENPAALNNKVPAFFLRSHWQLFASIKSLSKIFRSFNGSQDQCLVSPGTKCPS